MREKADGSLIVPRGLQTQTLQYAHALSAHLGQMKTIKKTEEMLYWPNLKADVCDYVKKCITCQRFKGDTGLQQPWKELPPADNPLPLQLTSLPHIHHHNFHFYPIFITNTTFITIPYSSPPPPRANLTNLYSIAEWLKITHMLP